VARVRPAVRARGLRARARAASTREGDVHVAEVCRHREGRAHGRVLRLLLWDAGGVGLRVRVRVRVRVCVGVRVRLAVRVELERMVRGVLAPHGAQGRHLRAWRGRRRGERMRVGALLLSLGLCPRMGVRGRGRGR